MPDERDPQLPQEDGRPVTLFLCECGDVRERAQAHWTPDFKRPCLKTAAATEFVPASQVAALRDEVERLSAECARCETCGHVQGEPNWCNRCGRRTRFPDWAGEQEAEVARLTARVEEWKHEAAENADQAERAVQRCEQLAARPSLTPSQIGDLANAVAYARQFLGEAKACDLLAALRAELNKEDDGG